MADIIEPNTHQIKRCVRITNIAEYSNYYFVGYITRPTGESIVVPIDSTKCLQKGYKFNTFEVLAVKEEVAKATKDLSKIKPDMEGVISLGTIETSGPYVNDMDKRISETIEYEIAMCNNQLELHKVKATTTYKDGKRYTETYPNECDENIIEKIISLLKSLFGI